MTKQVTHTVYDAAGKPHTVEPVDAREYVASGHYFREPPEAQKVAPAAPAAPEPAPTPTPTPAEQVVAEAKAADAKTKAKG
jgi:hypothetical protein